MTRRASSFELILPPRPEGTPSFHWLRNALRAEILNGRIEPGSKLPASRELARQFFTAMWHNRSYRLVPTRANGQPAFAVYVRDPLAGVAHANGLLVASLSGPRICTLTRFDNSVLPGFGLPRTLPD